MFTNKDCYFETTHESKWGHCWGVHADNEILIPSSFDVYLTKEDLKEMLKSIEDKEQGGVL